MKDKGQESTWAHLYLKNGSFVYKSLAKEAPPDCVADQN